MPRRGRPTPAPIVLASISSADHFPIQLALHRLQAYLLAHHAPEFRPPPVRVLVFAATDPPAEIVAAVASERPGLVGFSCYLWNIDRTLAVAAALKRRRPAPVIVLGGPEVSPRPAEVLAEAPAVDYVVRGEGEATFLELVESLLHRPRPAEQIAGLAFRDGGAPVLAPPRPQLASLDAIPSPYLDGLIPLPEGFAGTVPAETMRGCPYSCRYCYYHKDFQGIRTFSLARVERELAWILERRPHVVYLMDPTFNADRKRAKEILRLFIRHNRASRLHTELRAELLDRETVALLRDARACKLEIGLQSVDGATLDRVGRRVDLERFAGKLRLLVEAGLPFEMHLIDALPGHSYATVKRGIDWLAALRVPSIYVMQLSLLPGTELRAEAGRLGIEFDPRPGYGWRRTRDLTPADRERIEALRDGVGTLYNQGVLRETLLHLAERLAVPFTDLVEEWLAWPGRKQADPPLAFVRHLCEARGQPGLYWTAERLYRMRDAARAGGR